MNILDARERAFRLGATLSRLPDDLTVVAANLSSSLSDNMPEVLLLDPGWSPFDVRTRVDCETVRYRKDVDGVAICWTAKEPLPEGV